MIDWKCQLKLSAMIGSIATLATHSFMHHMIGFNSDLWFNAVIFLGATGAFMLGLRIGWIRCHLCPTPRKEPSDIR